MSPPKRLLEISLVVVFALAGLRAAHAANINNFQVFSLPNPSGPTPLLPGRLYVPPEAATSPRPLIVFLHGAGEAGTNNSLQVNVNIDNLLAEAKLRGAFLYAPQSPGDWGSTVRTDRVMTMVDQALADFNVNPNRLYVTGLSNGGGGTWNMISRYGDRFAAAVPICGVAPLADFSPPGLLDESIWAFHARNDGSVSVVNSRNRFNSILTAAGEPLPTYLTTAVHTDSLFNAATVDVHYTEYWTGDHGIWPRVYNGATNAAMYDWLFAHGVPEPTTAVLAVIGGVAIHNRRRNR